MCKAQSNAWYGVSGQGIKQKKRELVRAMQTQKFQMHACDVGERGCCSITVKEECRTGAVDVNAEFIMHAMPLSWWKEDWCRLVDARVRSSKPDKTHFV